MAKYTFSTAVVMKDPLNSTPCVWPSLTLTFIKMLQKGDHQTKIWFDLASWFSRSNEPDVKAIIDPASSINSFILLW